MCVWLFFLLLLCLLKSPPRLDFCARFCPQTRRPGRAGAGPGRSQTRAAERGGAPSRGQRRDDSLATGLSPRASRRSLRTKTQRARHRLQGRVTLLTRRGHDVAAPRAGQASVLSRALACSQVICSRRPESLLRPECWEKVPRGSAFRGEDTPPAQAPTALSITPASLSGDTKGAGSLEGCFLNLPAHPPANRTAGPSGAPKSTSGTACRGGADAGGVWAEG